MASKHIILTDRLQLVPFAPEHTDGLFVMNSNPEVMRYLGDVQTLEDVEKNIARVQARWEKSGYGWWAVLLKGSDTVIGAACLQNLANRENAALEIGWRLIPEFQGKGYATEAGRAAMDYGFETLGVDYLCAVANPENIASQKVMQRLGMHDVGVQTHYDEPCAYYELYKPV